MSQTESALYSGLSRGGCSLMGLDIAPTLISGVYKQNGTTQDNLNVIVLENHPADSRVKISEDNVFQTLSSRMGTGGGNVPMIMESKEVDMDAETRDKILRILQETYGEEEVLKWGIAVLDTLQQTEVLQQGVHEGGFQGKAEEGNKLDDSALPCEKHVAEWIMRDMRKQSECGCSSQGWESSEQRDNESAEIMQELSHESPSSAKALFDMWSKGKGIWLLQQTLHQIQEVRKPDDMQRAVVRRLTPTECSRLQGYPDGWCDIGDWVDSKGKVHKDADSAKYKALGNSIALPFWEWMAERMVEQLGEDNPTMASLFDGIGGFPLVYSRNGCKPVWASEIEEFPIAVTKIHSPEGEE